MSHETPQSEINGDPYKHMQIFLNPNGTLTRLYDDPHTSPSSDPTLPVLTKDLTINQSNNTWVRLFLPRKIISDTSSNKNKLPLIVFFHGSGFIVASAASIMFHKFCLEMADSVEAVVASVEYRLAPEHRLPAAYDDAMEALFFIRNSQDEWLKQYVDYSKCYVMGNSAGATIAYHAGLRAAGVADQLEPLKIQGLILRQVFFGGTERTESELRLANNPVIPLYVTDTLWELALPAGVDRDHEYCNFLAGNGILKFEKMKELGWRVLVSGNGGDLLVDREKKVAELMEEKGVKVVKDFEEEGGHGVELFEHDRAIQLYELLKHFIYSLDA